MSEWCQYSHVNVLYLTMMLFIYLFKFMNIMQMSGRKYRNDTETSKSKFQDWTLVYNFVVFYSALYSGLLYNGGNKPLHCIELVKEKLHLYMVDSLSHRFVKKNLCKLDLRIGEPMQICIHRRDNSPKPVNHRLTLKEGPKVKSNIRRFLAQDFM